MLLLGVPQNGCNLIWVHPPLPENLAAINGRKLQHRRMKCTCPGLGAINGKKFLLLVAYDEMYEYLKSNWHKSKIWAKLKDSPLNSKIKKIQLGVPSVFKIF